MCTSNNDKRFCCTRGVLVFPPDIDGYSAAHESTGAHSEIHHNSRRAGAMGAKWGVGGGTGGVHVCGSSHKVTEPGFFFDKAIANFLEKFCFSSVNLTNLC